MLMLACGACCVWCVASVVLRFGVYVIYLEGSTSLTNLVHLPLAPLSLAGSAPIRPNSEFDLCLVTPKSLPLTGLSRCPSSDEE